MNTHPNPRPQLRRGDPGIWCPLCGSDFLAEGHAGYCDEYMAHANFRGIETGGFERDRDPFLLAVVAGMFVLLFVAVVLAVIAA